MVLAKADRVDREGGRRVRGWWGEGGLRDVPIIPRTVVVAERWPPEVAGHVGIVLSSLGDEGWKEEWGACVP